jgi:hypothetical protein
MPRNGSKDFWSKDFFGQRIFGARSKDFFWVCVVRFVAVVLWVETGQWALYGGYDSPDIASLVTLSSPSAERGDFDLRVN